MALKTVTAEDEGLATAIAETEQEIFSEANGTEPLDNDGDKSLEEMGDGLEGEDTDEDTPDTEEGEAEEAETVETQGEEQPEQQRDERGRFEGVPPGRLREEAEKRREAEGQLTAKDAELISLRREMDALKAGLTQRPQVQQQEHKPAEPPDMFADPEGFRTYVIDQANQAAQYRHVESSLADAAETHGEKFQAAYAEAQRVGQSEVQQFGIGRSPTVNRIWSAPNPGKALMSWHAQQQTLREVGNDPQAYREKLREELMNDPDVQAQVIERARGSARQNGARSYSQSRMPPSLNGQTGSSHQVDDPDMYDNSERSVFEFGTR